MSSNGRAGRLSSIVSAIVDCSINGTTRTFVRTNVQLETLLARLGEAAAAFVANVEMRQDALRLHGGPGFTITWKPGVTHEQVVALFERRSE